MLDCIFGLNKVAHKEQWYDPLTHTYNNIYREVNTRLQRANDVVLTKMYVLLNYRSHTTSWLCVIDKRVKHTFVI